MFFSCKCVTKTKFSFNALACDHPAWWHSVSSVCLRAVAWIGSSSRDATVMTNRESHKWVWSKWLETTLRIYLMESVKMKLWMHIFASVATFKYKRLWDTFRKCQRISACCKIFKRPESDRLILNFYNKQGRGSRASIMAFLVSIFAVTYWPKEEWITNCMYTVWQNNIQSRFLFPVLDFCWW